MSHELLIESLPTRIIRVQAGKSEHAPVVDHVQLVRDRPVGVDTRTGWDRGEQSRSTLIGDNSCVSLIRSVAQTEGNISSTVIGEYTDFVRLTLVTGLLKRTLDRQLKDASSIHRAIIRDQDVGRFDEAKVGHWRRACLRS